MSRRSNLNDRLRSLFSFSKSQRRGILWLLPLLAVVGAVVYSASRPSFEVSFMELADRAARERKDAAGGVYGDDRQSVLGTTNGQRQPDSGDGSLSGAAPELFVFDPNTATLQEFCRLGLEVKTAAGIIKYRTRGKRFEIAEDFATCYGVTLAQYTRLEPYIRIGERFRAKTGGSRDYAGDDGRRWSGGEEPAAGAVGESSGSIAGAGASGGVGSADAPGTAGGTATGRQGVAPRPVVELNRADSAQLRGVSGIGEVLVVRIMEYRARLGGFARREQLAEIRGMTEENYERICKQISVDSCEIQKIDINFAPHKTLVERLGNHPYVTDRMLRKILKNRQLKGGWRTPGDMVNDDIMTREEVERLAPYLIFRAG